MTDSKRKKHSRDKEGDTIADPGLRPKSPREPRKPKNVRPQRPSPDELKFKKWKKKIKDMRDRPVQKLNIGGRANLLEEMGRIDARKHPDAADRAEKRRVIGELNKGYKHGNRVKKRNGGSAAQHYLQHGYGPHKSSRKVKSAGQALRGWGKVIK
tara:strand:- start:90 stop:554 length:465 start_codon:yes stop_codon:yes gene_type:complete